jgi:hypothetical protein
MMFAGMTFTIFDAVATVANNINRFVGVVMTSLIIVVYETLIHVILLLKYFFESFRWF